MAKHTQACNLCSAPIAGKTAWRKHWTARHLDISGYVPSYKIQGDRIISDPLTSPSPSGSIKKRSAKNNKGG